MTELPEKQKKKNQKISADFPFESKFLEIKGSKMHYIDKGKGDPILFLHGSPTSSYLWRNIIPYVTDLGRAIAPDLIGMGKSDKPDIDYGFFDTYEYLEAFIEKLGLENITLVVHDWGSGLGFHYANKHQDNIKGIAFMEAMIPQVNLDELPRSLRMGMKMMRTRGIGYFLVVILNMFIKGMLPRAIIRDLTMEEKAAYAEPYPTRKSRRPLLAWPRDVPINGKPERTAPIIDEYVNYMGITETPKLGFYVTPGAIIMENELNWIKENLSNLELINLGEGIHFIQEDHPHEIGEGIAKWYQKINQLQEKPKAVVGN